ncbi:MAG: TIGR02587 family membrane protein, partial [Vicinamibacteria bacterium]
EYARGVAGGLLFSLPLLYTVEVWLGGVVAPPRHSILYLLVTMALLVGYNRYAGMRRDANWAEVAIDSVEEMGLGLVLAAAILGLAGRIGPGVPVNEILGKVLFEAMTVAIGVSVGTAQLGAGDEAGQKDTGMEGDRRGSSRGAHGAGNEDLRFGGQLVIALCGAVLFASSVAPTEEIQTIAFETSSARLLGLGLLSLALGGVILFYSDFSGAHRKAPLSGLEPVIVDAVITYAVALFASAVFLWFFGRFEGLAPISCISQIVVLGLAATMGASAGRLLLQ